MRLIFSSFLVDIQFIFCVFFFLLFCLFHMFFLCWPTEETCFFTFIVAIVEVVHYIVKCFCSSMSDSDSFSAELRKMPIYYLLNKSKKERIVNGKNTTKHRNWKETKLFYIFIQLFHFSFFPFFVPDYFQRNWNERTIEFISGNRKKWDWIKQRGKKVLKMTLSINDNVCACEYLSAKQKS